jgi:hypothetical protein
MEKRFAQKLLKLLTIPAVTLVSAIAQYRAVIDEIRDINRKVKDV